MSKTYPFEGEQRTHAEVCKIVSYLPPRTVRKKLDAGVQTRGAMLSTHRPKPKPTTRARSLYNRESAR